MATDTTISGSISWSTLLADRPQQRRIHQKSSRENKKKKRGSPPRAPFHATDRTNPTANKPQNHGFLAARV